MRGRNGSSVGCGVGEGAGGLQANERTPVPRRRRSVRIRMFVSRSSGGSGCR
jgi:hypothetical protein